MTSLSNLSVLIVDPVGDIAFDLRQSFISAGAATHVVSSFATSQRLLDTKKIDAVVMAYSKSADTVDFCKVLATKNIPVVFTSEPPPRYPTRSLSSETKVAIESLIAQHEMTARANLLN